MSAFAFVLGLAAATLAACDAGGGRVRADGLAAADGRAPGDAPTRAPADTAPGSRSLGSAFARVTDDVGRDVRVDAPPARIVSLIPAVTEIILTLAGPDRLAARTEYDDDARLAHLPSAGRGLTPNLEWLARLRPDLVIAWADVPSRAVVSRLQELGVPVYAARIETLDDIDATIRRLATLLGVVERGDSLVASIRAELDAVRAAVAGRRRPSVLYIGDREPAYAAGPGSFVGELLAIAGGDNIFADAPAAWPQVGLEEIVRRGPEVVIAAVGEGLGDSLDWMRRAPGWRELPAVRTGRVHAVDSERYNRPGPRVGEVARELARLLHPDAFPDARPGPATAARPGAAADEAVRPAPGAPGPERPS